MGLKTWVRDQGLTVLWNTVIIPTRLAKDRRPN